MSSESCSLSFGHFDSLSLCFFGFLSKLVHTHGIRICIKRKKIHYGKFFDFCAEKCVYN